VVVHVLVAVVVALVHGFFVAEVVGGQSAQHTYNRGDSGASARAENIVFRRRRAGFLPSALAPAARSPQRHLAPGYPISFGAGDRVGEPVAGKKLGNQVLTFGAISSTAAIGKAPSTPHIPKTQAPSIRETFFGLPRQTARPRPRTQCCASCLDRVTPQHRAGTTRYSSRRLRATSTTRRTASRRFASEPRGRVRLEIFFAHVCSHPRPPHSSQGPTTKRGLSA
jgi:hypothetical protein